MAKLKDLVKENFSVLGGVVSTPPIGDTGSSLSGIVEDIYGKEEKISAKEVHEAIWQGIFKFQTNIWKSYRKFVMSEKMEN